MPQDDNGIRSRRSFLKYAGSITGTGLIAGCSAGGGGSNDDGSTGTATSTDTATPADSDGNSSGSNTSTEWQYGTAGEGSFNQIVGTGFAKVLDENSDKLNLVTNAQAGSEAAYRVCARGDIKSCGAPVPLGVAGFLETNPVKGINFSGNRSVDNPPYQGFGYATMREWFQTMKKTGIKTVDDLSGKRVSVGPQGSQFTALSILSTIGMLDEVETVNNDWSDIPVALKEGRVDASIGYAFAEDVMSGWAKQLQQEDMQVLTFSEEHLQSLRDSQYISTSVARVGDIFEKDVGPEEVECMRMDYTTWILPDADEDLAYEFTKQVLSRPDEVQQFHALLKRFSPEGAVEGLSTAVPVHPGVAKYLKEADLWDSDLEEA
jgi:TRAP-type uncharacterized transport system substrate-binding protein